MQLAQIRGLELIDNSGSANVSRRFGRGFTFYVTHLICSIHPLANPQFHTKAGVRLWLES
jgi:hypothetical protein